jgi:hypothetical protein
MKEIQSILTVRGQNCVFSVAQQCNLLRNMFSRSKTKTLSIQAQTEDHLNFGALFLVVLSFFPGDLSLEYRSLEYVSRVCFVLFVLF